MNWWRETNINIKEYAGHYRVIRRSLTDGSSYVKYVKSLDIAKSILKTDDSFQEEKGYYSQIEKYEKKVGMFLPIEEEKRKKVLKEIVLSLETEYEKKENELHKIKKQWIKLVGYYLGRYDKYFKKSKKRR